MSHPAAVSALVPKHQARAASGRPLLFIGRLIETPKPSRSPGTGIAGGPSTRSLEDPGWRAAVQGDRGELLVPPARVLRDGQASAGGREEGIEHRATRRLGHGMRIGAVAADDDQFEPVRHHYLSHRASVSEAAKVMALSAPKTLDRR